MGKKTNDKKEKNFIEFLKEKKTRDGKLNKLGEWLLTNGHSEDNVYYDMRAVMK